MKLIHCYIENFGKLKNQRIDFSDGCHCFCHENGWGKSTLAAFLTVMLYGFENERSRDDYTNERKRYRPWQGGVYGGTLTFEICGKRYRVERTFGLKEKEDFFFLRDEDTNLETKVYSSNLGEEIFGLDRFSFEKTIFLSQKDCGTKTTDRIQARLGNLAEATEDMNQYEKADERLHNLLNAMSPHRKTGSLYRLKEQIGDLEAELRIGETLDREMESLILEKKQTEDAYKKYKEIQELLLNQQKQITVNHSGNRKDKSDCSEEQQKNEKNDVFSENRGKQKKGLSLFLLVSGILIVMSGAYFMSAYRKMGIFLLAAGVIMICTAFILVQRKQNIYKKERDNCNKFLLGQKKKREEERIEERIEEQQIEEQQIKEQEIREQQIEEKLEEVQQRLRKIQAMIENCYRKMIHLEQAIQENMKKKERLLEKEEQAVFLKEQYSSKMMKYERLKMTKAYLAKAREVYLAKYRSPLMHSFSRYFEYVSGVGSEKLRMDVNLNLTVQESGIQREARYYSEGWKDLFGICMRMALVDVMYQKEKPFLIMDDPFVNLDQSKTQAALDFVNQLGREYQILYFTCHESRRLEKREVS